MTDTQYAGCVDVISCGTDFPSAPEILAVLKQADIVYGSRALCSVCPVPLKETRIIASGARQDAVTALLLARKGKNVAVLASGDALYHGFGGTLAELSLPEDRLNYHPGTTVFQSLFCRLGLPWSSVRLFSMHTGKEESSIRQIAEATCSVTYAGSRYPVQRIARKIIELHPESAQRAAVVAERLGSADEHIDIDTLDILAKKEYGPTSILVLFSFPYRAESPLGESFFKQRERAVQAPVLALGLPEEVFARENNLITASDVRAVIQARLRLPSWGILWDVGAGSGSVGLEAAALRPDLQVFGIERNQRRCELILHNREHLGVHNYTLLAGEACTVIRAGHAPIGGSDGPEQELPCPDRVFIGGGGKSLPEIMELCMERLRPGGRMVVSAVTLESFAVLLLWHPEKRSALCRLCVSQEQPLAGNYHHFSSQHSIYLFTFQKEMSHESIC